MLMPVFHSWGEQFRWSLTNADCQRAFQEQQAAMAALNILYDVALILDETTKHPGC